MINRGANGLSASIHWSDWQERRNRERVIAEEQGRSTFVDWADHPTILAEVFSRAFGSPEYDFFDYISDHLPGWRSAHVLSLGCGDGAFERELISRGLASKITGLDVSPARVEAAKQSSSSFADRLDFQCADLDQGDLGAGTFGGVIAKSSLHHVAGLERLGEALLRAVRPQSMMLAIDFFGPTRFQWSDLQLELANEFIRHSIPNDLRQLSVGGIAPPATRMSPQDLIALDPSEAVRSGDLMRWLNDLLEIREVKPLGGTLLNLVFYGPVVNNFVPGLKEHDDIVREASRLEASLIDAGILPSDFQLVLGRFR